MSRYHDKVAVVTGAAQGIGEAITRALMAEGAAVVMLDLDAELLGRLANELGDRSDFVVGDVTRTNDSGEMVRRAVDRFGALDVAFNVAGWARVSSFIATPEEMWDRTLDICLKGVFLAMQHEARQMIKSDVGGAIVNVASMNSEVPMSGGAAYCAAKAGVDMLSRCGALEFAEHGIRVNTLSPGLVATQMKQFILEDAERSRILTDRIPAGRPASPAEIAKAALFLGSDDAAYASGTNLFVDGAWQHAAYPDMRAMAA